MKKYLALLVLVFLLINKNQVSGKNAAKNVLFIVADDLGWSDVGFEDVQVQTPNIDFLAKNGIILNQSYAYSLCTPSRNSILTGVYAEHTGLQHSVILPEQPVGIPTSFKLMPQFFKEFGYQTHMIGKWHLGYCNRKYTPVGRGFDSFYGFFNAQEDYYLHRTTAQLVFKSAEGLDYWNQTNDYIEPVLDKNNTYSTFTFTQRALEILDSHDKNKPFFMYFSSQNAHLPNQVPEEYENKYYYIENPDRRKILGMVSMLDEAIGNITKKLKDLDMIDNTLIFFTSDNGAPVYSAGRNFPLRGGKMTAFEGGHRVRAFINGPQINPSVYNGMFHAVDWLPTVLNAALNVPIELNGIDGINQWSSLTKNTQSNRTSFIYNIDPLGQVGCFWRPTEAIRVEDWKLIKGCAGIFDDWYPFPNLDKDFVETYYERFSIFGKKTTKGSKYKAKNNSLYLFNIKEDPFERNNLAQVYPEKVKELNNRLEEYKKTSVKPLVTPALLPDKNADPVHWGDKWSPGWC